jgi:signal transduction histidine kinase
VDEQDTEKSTVGHFAGAGEGMLTSSTLTIATTTRWLRILQRVTDGAIAHLDLQELLRDLLGRIREAMQVDNTAILLLSEDQKYLTVYAARGPEEQVTGQVHVPMGRGVAGTIAASGKPIIIDDLSKVEVENPLLRATVCSLVGVPLRLGPRVIGVIHIDSARPRRFTTEDSELLQVIASRVALAIEHARLYEAERAARHEAEAVTRQLQVLQAVSDVALEHARLGSLLRALLQRIQQMLEVENVAILLLTPDGGELTLYSVRGPEEAVMGQVHVPIGQGVAGTIAATREPLIVENLASVPVVNPFLREHFRSLLGVPLLADGRLVGVIHVDSVQPRRFTEEDSQLLQVLADRIAVAIDRAQQYESAEHDRAEAERRVAVLQELTDRMDEFLSIASHELRTPLTSLAMNVQMLDIWLNAQRGKRTDEPAAEYAVRAVAAAQPLVQRSSHSIKRLDRLLDDLLDAVRIREGRLALQPRRTNLISLVREIIEEHQQADAAARTMRLTVEAQEPVVVQADPDRMGQVVSNYLSNALKYSRSELPVTVTLQMEADQARVSVRDEGVGIPQPELDHIWERFYRVAGIGHQSGSQVGLGLGLYICRDIVERHGGQVGVQSQPGKGSTFWFTLPVCGP